MLDYKFRNSQLDLRLFQIQGRHGNCDLLSVWDELLVVVEKPREEKRSV